MAWTWDRLSDTLHVVPVNDLIDHDCDDTGDCICGPDLEIIVRPDASDAHMYSHHALDGRD